MNFLSAIRHRLITYTTYCFLPILRNKRRIKRNHELVILCYHRVNNKTGIFYDRNISADIKEFKSQMLYIKKHFNIISIEQLINYYMGESNLKPNSIMITFDDGFKDNELNAFPILEELGIPAVVFLTTGFINSDDVPWEDQISYVFKKLFIEEIIINKKEIYSLRSPEEKENSIWKFCKKLKMINPDIRKEIIEGLIDKYKIDKEKMKELGHSMSIGYMSKKDIQYWSNHGIDFGIHTVTHPCLTTLNEERIYEEISESKKALETIIDKPVNAFAYPYGKKGDFNHVTASLLKKAGITTGMIFEPGINNLDDSNLLELFRFGVGRNINFKLACYGFTGYTDIFKKTRDAL